MTNANSPRIRSKTIAAMLAFFVGIFGIHRFYLFGLRDVWAWLTPFPTLAGLVGLARFSTLGPNDLLAWLLIPVFGLSVAVACGTAIFYALMHGARWQSHYNPGAKLDESHPSGQTNWVCIIVVVAALMLGAVALMSSLVMSFQAYFENQVEAAPMISQ